MRRWEYLDFGITRPEGGEWSALSLYTGEELLDMSNILNHYGPEGWELVNMVDELSVTNENGVRDVRIYRAIFKRPLED